MRKSIIILLLIMVVLRELGYINLNYYHSNTTKNSSGSWNVSSTRVHGSSRSFNPSMAHRQNQEVPVRLEYRGEVLYEDPSSGITAVVTIDELNNGFLWVPLYKTSSFSSSAYVMLEGAYDGMYWNGKWVDQLDLSGRLSLSGNISISGLCSRHTAVGLVQQEIVRDIVAKTKRYFTQNRLGF